MKNKNKFFLILYCLLLLGFIFTGLLAQTLYRLANTRAKIKKPSSILKKHEKISNIKMIQKPKNILKRLLEQITIY